MCGRAMKVAVPLREMNWGLVQLYCGIVGTRLSLVVSMIFWKEYVGVSGSELRSRQYCFALDGERK